MSIFLRATSNCFKVQRQSWLSGSPILGNFYYRAWITFSFSFDCAELLSSPPSTLRKTLSCFGCFGFVRDLAFFFLRRRPLCPFGTLLPIYLMSLLLLSALLWCSILITMLRKSFALPEKLPQPCCSTLLPLPAQLNFKYFATVNVNWKICASQKLA